MKIGGSALINSFRPLAIACALTTLSLVAFAQDKGGEEGGGGGIVGANLLDTVHQGGWVMYVILGTSVIGLFFIFEATFRLRRKGVLTRAQADQLRAIKDPADVGDIVEKTEDNVMGRILTNAWHWRFSTPEEVKNAIEESIDIHMWRLNRVSRPLGIIASITPLLGLLGTVFGIIEAFDVVAKEGSLGDPGKLAGGISKALLTTGFGLIVAIPMSLAHQFYVGKTEYLMRSCEELVKGAMVPAPEEE